MSVAQEATPEKQKAPILKGLFADAAIEPEVQTLLDGLASEDVDELKTALKGLEEQGPKALGALPEVGRLLEHKNRDVRNEARDALIAIGCGPIHPLIDYWAPWCGPCRQTAPIVQKLIDEGYRIRKINTDEHEQFLVRSIPTFLIEGGEEHIGSHVGLVTEEELRELVALIPEESRMETEFPGDADWDVKAEAKLWGFLLATSVSSDWRRIDAQAVVAAQKGKLDARLIAMITREDVPVVLRGLAVQHLSTSEDADIQESLASLASMLMSDDQQPITMRGQAAVVLARTGQLDDAVYEVLRQTLVAEIDARTRVLAAEQIAQSGRPGAAAILIEQVETVELSVRRACVKGIVLCGDEAVACVPKMFDSLLVHKEYFDSSVSESIVAITEQHPEAAVHAADALVKSSKLEGYKYEFYRDAYSSVAISVLETVPNLQEYSARFVPLLDHERDFLRLSVARLLSRDPTKAEVVLPRLIALIGVYDVSEVRGSIEKMGLHAVPPLVDVLTSKEQEPETRAEVGRLLAGMYDVTNAVSRLLMPKFDEGDETTQLWTAVIAAKSGRANAKTLAVLEKGLTLEDEEAREMVVDSLTNLPATPEVDDLLIGLLSDEEIGYSVTYTLSDHELTPTQVERIAKLLEEEEPKPAVVTVASSLLTEHPELLNGLKKPLAEADNDSVSQIGYSLWSKHPELLINLVVDEEIPVENRVALLEIVAGQLKDVSPYADRLLPLLESEEAGLVLGAAATLAEIPDHQERMLPILVQGLEGEDWRQANVARVGLRRLPADVVAASMLPLLLKSDDEEFLSRCINAIGVLSATIRPSAMMIARVQTASTSSRIWVDMMIAFSLAIWRISRRISCF